MVLIGLVVAEPVSKYGFELLPRYFWRVQF
jgi:hypothetical protein